MESIFGLYKTVLKTRQFFVLRDFYATSFDFKMLFCDEQQEIGEWQMAKGVLRIERHTKGEVAPQTFCLKTSDWRAAKSFLATKNIPLGPVKMKEGKPFFELKDPDQNTIEIIETL